MMTSVSPLPRTACNGTLKDTTGYPSVVYRGETLYFCLRACQRVFETDPERFLAGELPHPAEEIDETALTP
jgi:YHS domain-containing protein